MGLWLHQPQRPVNALERRRANWLHVALVAELLRGATERESARHLALGWEQAQEAAQAAYVQQGVVRAAAEGYFDGVSPLFPDVADEVARQVGEIERVVGIFNNILGTPVPSRPGSKRARGAEPSPSPLDLAQVRLGANPAIRAELALVVDLSKAEALRLIGEQEQGYALVGRHMWGA